MIASEKSLEELSREFKAVFQIWMSSRMHDKLMSLFLGIRFPPDITKVVCFGLGKLKDDETGKFCRKNMMQHAAALSMAKWLGIRAGNPIQIFAQDPAYRDDDMSVLSQQGITVVGNYGAAGFAEIDLKSFVLAINPQFRVREIIADMPRPAGMICRPFNHNPDTEIKDYGRVEVLVATPEGRIFGGK
jgi:hypothetical protein